MRISRLINALSRRLDHLYESLIDPVRRERTAIVTLAAYLLLWTLYGFLAKGSQDIHPDMAELIAWSRQLEFGYLKHPPLGALVVRFWFADLSNRRLVLLFTVHFGCYTCALDCMAPVSRLSGCPKACGRCGIADARSVLQLPRAYFQRKHSPLAAMGGDHSLVSALIWNTEPFLCRARRGRGCRMSLRQILVRLSLVRIGHCRNATPRTGDLFLLARTLDNKRHLRCNVCSAFQLADRPWFCPVSLCNGCSRRYALWGCSAQRDKISCRVPALRRTACHFDNDGGQAASNSTRGYDVAQQFKSSVGRIVVLGATAQPDWHRDARWL